MYLFVVVYTPIEILFTLFFYFLLQILCFYHMRSLPYMQQILELSSLMKILLSLFFSTDFMLMRSLLYMQQILELSLLMMLTCIALTLN